MPVAAVMMWQEVEMGGLFKYSGMATEVAQSLVGLCHLLIHGTVGSHHLEVQQDQKTNQKIEDSPKPRGDAPAWLRCFPFSYFHLSTKKSK